MWQNRATRERIRLTFPRCWDDHEKNMTVEFDKDALWLEISHQWEMKQSIVSTSFPETPNESHRMFEWPDQWSSLQLTVVIWSSKNNQSTVVQIHRQRGRTAVWFVPSSSSSRSILVTESDWRGCTAWLERKNQCKSTIYLFSIRWAMLSDQSLSLARARAVRRDARRRSDVSFFFSLSPLLCIRDYIGFALLSWVRFVSFFSLSLSPSLVRSEY